MGLPKIDSPEFNLTLPVTKTKIKYRPFKVKEEKLMLIAQQTGESGAISNAIKGVIQNCVLNLDEGMTDCAPGTKNLKPTKIFVFYF